MGRIYLLDEVTANQIAAGEVIERPASVIKELIENAIDAQADIINVYLEDGGIKSIKVVDNGTGMSSDDALKAFQRHATSKIRGINDLDQLSTLGFRGEALASISSVARVKLITRTPEELSGIKIIFEGGKLVSKEDSASSVGTNIKVADLFFNTPARKKSLKSTQRELAVTNELIHKLSLANPSVGFALYNNSRLIFNAVKGLALKQRLFDVYGIEIAKEMIKFQASNHSFTVTGFIGKSTVSRNSRSHQAIFINNRFVKCSLISRAVEDGYHTYLMINRLPVFVLHVSVNPSLVDVNIHPTKMEVRFDQEQVLSELIRNEVQATLGQKEIWMAPKKAYDPKEKTEQTKLQFKENQNPCYFERVTNNNDNTTQTQSDSNLKEIITNVQISREATNIGLELEEFGKELNDLAITQEQKLPDLIPLGQINASYIVCQGEDGLCLIDQHAAHERILYEKLMAQDQEKIPAQQMLIPNTLELKAGYSQLLIENIILFSDLGFIIEHFGGDTFIIRGVPHDLQQFNEQDLLLDLLDELKRSATLDTVKVKEKMIIQIACKGAIKAGEKLEPEEINKLIRLLNQQGNPYTCPHGRPTIVQISGYELDKKFKRIL